MSPVRLLVVDDQQLLRRGLVMLFSTIEEVEVVAEAAHGQEALAVLRSHEVDVVLADAKMPVMDGVTLVRQVAGLHPGLPVLVLTTFDEPDIGELLARGWTNRQIADHLVLAEGTVKNHVSALLRKLAAPDRTAAALALYRALHPSGR